jgi:hypothetical protein
MRKILVRKGPAVSPVVVLNSDCLATRQFVCDLLDCFVVATGNQAKVEKFRKTVRAAMFERQNMEAYQQGNSQPLAEVTTSKTIQAVVDPAKPRPLSPWPF